MKRFCPYLVFHFTLSIAVATLAVSAAESADAPAGDSKVYPAAEVEKKPEIVAQVSVSLPSGLSEAEAYVAVLVEIDGSVGEAQLVKSSDTRFGERATAAAKKFRFKPAQKRGHAVRCVTVLPFASRIRTGMH